MPLASALPAKHTTRIRICEGWRGVIGGSRIGFVLVVLAVLAALVYRLWPAGEEARLGSSTPIASVTSNAAAPDPAAPPKPISSDGGPSSDVALAFDGRNDTWWTSELAGADVKGKAWIGVAYPRPVRLEQLRLVQTTDKSFRQDAVRLQMSGNDGRTWRDAVPAPLDARADFLTVGLDPELPAATQWRLLAAGDNAVLPEHHWTPIEVVFVPVAQYRPISSDGAVSETAAQAFDGRKDTWWESKLRGTAVKGAAWIGLAFDHPRKVTRVKLIQTTSKPFRQDAVMVQYSEHGSDWKNAMGRPVDTVADQVRIDLPLDLPKVRYWRVVAAADNAISQAHAWTPIEVTFVGE
jgi:hypothetical protein